MSNLSLEEERLTNMQVGYACLEKQFEEKIGVITKIDEKVNMFLVFNAANIVLLTIVFPLPNFCFAQYIASWVLFSIFCLSMVLTVVVSVIAIFPRGVQVIDPQYLTNFKIYTKHSVDFLENLMKGFDKNIQVLDNVLAKKNKYMNLSIVFTVLNFFLMIVLIIITSL